MIRVLAVVILLSLVGVTNGFVPNPTTRTCFVPLSSSTKNEEGTQIIVNNPRLEGLSFMLDDGTRKSHLVAENTAFVTGFFKGLSTKNSYQSLLTSLWFVYGAMERAFDECQLKDVQRLDNKELRRIEGLRADMDYFYGKKWLRKHYWSRFSPQRLLMSPSSFYRRRPSIVDVIPTAIGSVDYYSFQKKGGGASVDSPLQDPSLCRRRCRFRRSFVVHCCTTVIPPKERTRSKQYGRHEIPKRTLRHTLTKTTIRSFPSDNHRIRSRNASLLEHKLSTSCVIFVANRLVVSGNGVAHVLSSRTVRCR